MGEETKVYALDAYFKDIPIGFLKADIEGYELDMLDEVTELIRRYKPLVAICIYYQSSDIYKIPLMLEKLNSDYRLSIGQHYYGYTDTVLYAY